MNKICFLRKKQIFLFLYIILCIIMHKNKPIKWYKGNIVLYSLIQEIKEDESNYLFDERWSSGEALSPRFRM